MVWGILSFLLSLIQSLSSIAGATPIVVLSVGEFASFDSMLKFHVWCLIASLAQFSRYTSKVTPMILTRGFGFCFTVPASIRNRGKIHVRCHR